MAGIKFRVSYSKECSRLKFLICSIPFLEIKPCELGSINFDTNQNHLLCAIVFDCVDKVEKILKGSLDSIQSPSPSVKTQIMREKICWRCKGKTYLGIVNKLLETKSLLTSSNNVLSYCFK